MGFNNNSSGGNYKPLAEINVTPFVDVMLVLLIIFMVTSPMMISGVTVDLPKTTPNQLAAIEDPLSVTINKKGEIFLQNSQIKLSELTVKINAISGENKEIRIIVRGDKDVDYGSVMQVIADINSAGYTKVALLTDIEN